MDRGAWQVTVIGVAKSQTQLGKKAQAQHNYSGRKAESLSSFTVCRLSSAWLVVRSQDGASGLCAQPEVTVLHQMGVLFHIEELRDLYQLDMYNPWGGTRTLPDHGTIVSRLPFLYLCIP